MMKRSVLLAAGLLLGAPSLHAQAVPQAPSHPVTVSAPAARPEDVATLESIVAALYDVISGPAGQARDWNRLRSLFIPGGRLLPSGVRADGSVGIRVMEVNDYIAVTGPWLERVGFREREIARRVERFGHIAHVFSTYEGRTETEATVTRGINSIQLLNDGTRWWVVSVYWEGERPDNPLPSQYLPWAAHWSPEARGNGSGERATSPVIVCASSSGAQLSLPRSAHVRDRSNPVAAEVLLCR